MRNIFTKEELTNLITDAWREALIEEYMERNGLTEKAATLLADAVMKEHDERVNRAKEICNISEEDERLFIEGFILSLSKPVFDYPPVNLFYIDKDRIPGFDNFEGDDDEQ